MRRGTVQSERSRDPRDDPDRVRAAHATSPESPTRRGWTPWLPALATLAAVWALLVGAGAAPLDVARYSAYAVWGLVLPGTLVYRSLRRESHSLFDDLAMGTVLGLTLEVAAWAVFSALDARSFLIAWPLLVVVPFLAVPRLRRHWHLRPGAHRPSTGWSWAVAGVVVAAVAYPVLATWTTPSLPADSGSHYHIDLVYLLSIVGEAKHHFPLQVPGVAGEPLHYHYFAFAHQATASLVSGVDTPVVFFRLTLPLHAIIAATALASAAWRVVGRPWTAALAATLTLVVGELTVWPLSGTGIGSVYAYYSWSSVSLTYSLAFTFALMAVVVEILRAGESRASALRTGESGSGPRRWERGPWLILALLAAGAAGAKSTVLPVVMAGLGVVALVQLVTARRIRSEVIASIAVLGGISLLAVAVLFRFQAHGLAIAPFATIERAAAADAASRDRLVALVGAALTYGWYMLARLAGIPVLARLRRRAWSTREWFLLGAVGAGLVATIAAFHPAYGQNYFISTGFVFGAVLSAMGFAALVDRHRLSPAAVGTILVGAAGATALTLYLLRAQPKIYSFIASLRLPGHQSIVAAAVALAAVIGLAAVVWHLFLRQRLARGVGAAALLATLLLAGAGTYLVDARLQLGSSAHNWGYHLVLTADQTNAARWLREHSSPDDLVAINEHCITLDPATGKCHELIWWLNAFAERRTLAGSSSYAPAFLQRGRVSTEWRTLLAHNDVVFYRPTQQAVDRLRTNYGVRWLVVNRAVRPEAPELAGYAALRYENQQVAIYELP